MTEYRQSGTGKPVVLLHGWGDNMESWTGVAASLEGTHQVNILDLPGFGKSQAPKNTWGLNEYAEFVGEFLKKLEIIPEVIIGHSNGGAIAIRGLASGSLKADKLILLASSGIRDAYKGRTRVIRAIA